MLPLVADTLEEKWRGRTTHQNPECHFFSITSFIVMIVTQILCVDTTLTLQMQLNSELTIALHTSWQDHFHVTSLLRYQGARTKSYVCLNAVRLASILIT